MNLFMYVVSLIRSRHCRVEGVLWQVEEDEELAVYIYI